MDKRDLESLSAAVDNELTASQFADWLADDDQACSQTWQRYHLIGDALRDELPAQINLDLTAQIAKAIDDEPAILAPNAVGLKALEANHEANDNESQLAENKPSKVVPLFKQFGQYAIAASVALFAVIGVQQYQLQDEQSYSPQLHTRPLIGSVAPVSLQTPSVQETRQQLTEAQYLEQSKRLNSYIQDHHLQQRLLGRQQAMDATVTDRVDGAQ